MLQFFPDRTFSSLRNKLFLLKIKSQATSRHHTYDESFWDEYTLLNCYWGGFIMADGSVSYKSEKSTELSIGINDVDLLYRFQNDIKTTYPITPQKDRDAFSRIKCQVNSNWRINLAEKFNIIPRKTYCAKFPYQVPPDLFPYFLGLL